MSMPRGDTPEKVQDFYLYLQGHQETTHPVQTWHVDWMSLAWLWGFVNHANLCQAIYWAVRPSGLGRTDGQMFLDLLERRGLLHAETLRQELAAEIPFFAPLKDGRLGEYGVRL